MIHYYGLYARHQAKKLKRIVEGLVRCFNQEGWEAEQEKLLAEILSFPTTYRERVDLKSSSPKGKELYLTFCVFFCIFMGND